MKKTLISIALIAALTAFPDIGPNTTLDNVPGDMTVRQIVEAGGGGSGGSSVPGGYDDATNKAYLAYASVGRKLDSKKLSWYSDDELDFDTSQPDGGLFFRDSWENIGIGILTDGDYWYIRSAYTDWSWLMNLEGDTLQDKIGEMEFDIRIASMHAMSTNPNPHHVTADQIGAVPKSRQINGNPLTSNITLDASDVGAFGAAAGASLQTQVSAIGAHLNAEDAHFVSTNYDSVTRIPEAYVEIKMNGSWLTIWREMTRWNKWTGPDFDWTGWNGFNVWKTNIESEVSHKAERSWGMYDSETGGLSPDGYTQISSSNILIAAGMAYQRTVTTDGAVWVLQCNTGTASLGGDTNGFFRVLDADGNTQFEIVKGDKREMGADAAGIEVDNSGYTPIVTIPYSVESGEHPTIQVCTDLSTADWRAEDDAACPALVSWSGSSGAWVARVALKTPGNQLFVRATFMAGGETYIRNVAPVSMDSIMLNGTKYYLGTATIDGHTVLTLSTTKPTN